MWHAGGTAGEYDVAPPGTNGYQLAGQVRSVPGDDGLVGKPHTRRGSQLGGRDHGPTGAL